MKDLLDRSHLHRLAVESGFCQRHSRLSPEVFFDMLFHLVSNSEQASLSQMVSILYSEFSVAVSKQSLDERFNDGCVDFVRAVLTEVLQEHFENLYDRDLLPGFRRILIKDSTKFTAPPNLEAKYKSCGGDARARSKACVSIQYEHDLKSGEITDINITSGNRNDRRDAGETEDRFVAGDLIIRDLGYFSTPVLEKCTGAGAFFLSRLDCQTLVYDMDGKPVSFGTVYGKMKKSGTEEMEMNVFIGGKTKLPVRMILRIVPDTVYETRIREKTKKSKGQGRVQLKMETKIRCRFNILITNANEEDLKTSQVYSLYRLRWQVELHFKAWKSVFGVDCITRRMKEQRYIALLYVKLMMIVICLQITHSLQQSLPLRKQNNKVWIISINKALKTLRGMFGRLWSMIRGSRRQIRKTALLIKEVLSKNHWLESKKDKMCLPEIIELFICLSDK